MILPSGKLINTALGGRENLSAILKDATENKLSGFISGSLTKSGKTAIGYLLFNNGKICGVYYAGDTELYAEQALTRVLLILLDPDSVIEVHTFAYRSSSINVEFLLQKYPEVIYTPNKEYTELIQEAMEVAKGEGETKRLALLAEMEKKVSQEPVMGSVAEKLPESYEDTTILREEIERLKASSLTLLKHLSGKEKGDIEEIAEKRILEMKIAKEMEELERKKQELASIEKNLREQEAKLKAYESDLRAKEENLYKEMEKLSHEKIEISRAWSDLAAQIEKNADTKKNIEKKLEEMVKREEEFLNRERKLAMEEEKVVNENKRIEDRLKEIQAEEEKLRELALNIGRREEELNKRERELKNANLEISKKLEEIEERKRTYEQSELKLEKERKKLQEEKDALEKEKTFIEKEKESLKTKFEELDAMRKKIEEKRGELTE
ncbi:MAG: hypothetical protein ACP5LE_05635, partial [Thermoplasmata archaeon]